MKDVKYSIKYLDDIINIVELLKAQQSHSLAYKLMTLFLIEYKVKVDSKYDPVTKKEKYIRARYIFLHIDGLKLYFDTHTPYSIFYVSKKCDKSDFVTADSHLVFINDKYNYFDMIQDEPNAYHTKANCEFVIKLINNYKNKMYGN